MTQEVVRLFTDGACQGNPGPGGWGALLQYRATEKELSGGESHTTNNRMELMAVIGGLEALTHPVCVDVYTDSLYVKNGMTQWLPKWKASQWKTSQKKDVKNVDLWMKLESCTQIHTVQWFWVKGHSGVVENERVDQLARAAIPCGSVGSSGVQ